jgi:putative membrane protein
MTTTTTAARPFYGRPYNWLLFALALLAVPLVGYMVQSGMRWERMHPAINAMLNGSSAVFLTAGYVAIRRKQVELHRMCMVSAFSTSSLFLASYLARFAMSGAHVYPGHGWDRTLYLAILFSHMLLAVAVVPMTLRSLYLAWKRRFEAHRRLARWTWPIWMYVSVTGVVVYLMLYH